MAAHTPIMVEEVLAFLRPTAGDVAVDCTLGSGGHAAAILERIQPGGRLIGLDVDRVELDRTTATLRSAGFGTHTFVPRHASFTTLRQVLDDEHLAGVDMVLVDLGVSTMQADDPSRGFHYKAAGPLDMRMNPEAGDTAAALIQRLSTPHLEAMLRDNADEPHAREIAALVKQRTIATTQALERTIRLGLAAVNPDLTKPQLKMSVRRTFQALRIAVNDESTALDALLASLASVLKPGGRVVCLTFHSGEDRRVKQAFRSGWRDGLYAAVARTVTKSTMAETRSNRRASSAKLRWALRAPLP